MRNITSYRRSHGFTIVELLIVVVVIAILAAISIVAYSGVSNSANDSTVKSDLTNFAKAIQMYKVENGHYPVAGSFAIAHGGFNSSTMSNINFKPSRSAYDTTSSNFFYCNGQRLGVPSFNLAARSKSGTLFVYTPDTGIQTSSRTVANACYGADVWDGAGGGVDYGYSYDYYSVTDAWYSWTN